MSIPNAQDRMLGGLTLKPRLPAEATNLDLFLAGYEVPGVDDSPKVEDFASPMEAFLSGVDIPGKPRGTIAQDVGVSVLAGITALPRAVPAAAEALAGMLDAPIAYGAAGLARLGVGSASTDPQENTRLLPRLRGKGLVSGANKAMDEGLEAMRTEAYRSGDTTHQLAGSVVEFIVSLPNLAAIEARGGVKMLAASFGGEGAAHAWLEEERKGSPTWAKWTAALGAAGIDSTVALAMGPVLQRARGSSKVTAEDFLKGKATVEEALAGKKAANKLRALAGESLGFGGISAAQQAQHNLFSGGLETLQGKDKSTELLTGTGQAFASGALGGLFMSGASMSSGAARSRSLEKSHKSIREALERAMAEPEKTEVPKAQATPGVRRLAQLSPADQAVVDLAQERTGTGRLEIYEPTEEVDVKIVARLKEMGVRAAPAERADGKALPYEAFIPDNKGDLLLYDGRMSPERKIAILAYHEVAHILKVRDPELWEALRSGMEQSAPELWEESNAVYSGTVADYNKGRPKSQRINVKQREDARSDETYAHSIERLAQLGEAIRGNRERAARVITKDYGAWENIVRRLVEMMRFVGLTDKATKWEEETAAIIAEGGFFKEGALTNRITPGTALELVSKFVEATDTLATELKNSEIKYKEAEKGSQKLLGPHAEEAGPGRAEFRESKRRERLDKQASESSSRMMPTQKMPGEGGKEHPLRNVPLVGINDILKTESAYEAERTPRLLESFGWDQKKIDNYMRLRAEARASKGREHDRALIFDVMEGMRDSLSADQRRILDETNSGFTVDELTSAAAAAREDQSAWEIAGRGNVARATEQAERGNAAWKGVGTERRFSLKRHPQEDTPEFKRWAKGRTVYKAFHGTGSLDEDMPGGTITRFNGMSDKFDHGRWLSQMGDWFTDDARVAEHFADIKEDGQIIPVHIRMKKPYEVFDYGDLEDAVKESGKTVQGFAADLMKQGYDGVVISRSTTDTDIPRTDFVLFESGSNVKSSMGNNGDFSENPDTRYSLKRKDGLDLSDPEHRKAYEETTPATWKSSPEEIARADRAERKFGTRPYTSEGQRTVAVAGFSLKREPNKKWVKDPTTGKNYIDEEGNKTEIPGGYGTDPDTGLFLNAPLGKSGVSTVTVYYHTTEERSRQFTLDKMLRGDNETSDKIYLTSESDSNEIAKLPSEIAKQERDGAVVVISLRPELLEPLEVHANGRRDFFVPIAEGDAFKRKMSVKLHTLVKKRSEAINGGKTTLLEVITRLEAGADGYMKLPPEQQKKELARARKLLRDVHNVGNVLTENRKMEKSQARLSGIDWQGKDIMSRGIGLAAAQRISEKSSMCTNAASCMGLCLGDNSGGNYVYGGRGSTRSGARLSQYLKTEAMVMHPEEFAIVAYEQIKAFAAAVEKQGAQPAIRFNVTSDIPPKAYESIIKALPNVEFYDYTKLAGSKEIAPNHHLTFSLSGVSQVVNGEQVIAPWTNWDDMVTNLSDGKNVAMPFTVFARRGRETPFPKFVYDAKTGKTFRVINGDKYDARFIERQPEGEDGVIVALSNKDMRSKKDWQTSYREDMALQRTPGFFVHYEPNAKQTLVIANQEKLKVGEVDMGRSDVVDAGRFSLKRKEEPYSFGKWPGDVEPEPAAPEIKHHKDQAKFRFPQTPEQRAKKAAARKNRTAEMEAARGETSPMDDARLRDLLETTRLFVQEKNKHPGQFVFGIDPLRIKPGETISNIIKGYTEEKIPGFKLVGKTVQTPEDLARLVGVLRSPFAERSAYLVMRGKPDSTLSSVAGHEVLYSEVISIGSDGSVFGPQDIGSKVFGTRSQKGIDQNQAAAEAAMRISSAIEEARSVHGDDNVYVIDIHNHPGGDSSPSSSDFDAINGRAKYHGVRGALFGMVVNHGTFDVWRHDRVLIGRGAMIMQLTGKRQAIKRVVSHEKQIYRTEAMGIEPTQVGSFLFDLKEGLQRSKDIEDLFMFVRPEQQGVFTLIGLTPLGAIQAVGTAGRDASNGRIDTKQVHDFISKTGSNMVFVGTEGEHDARATASVLKLHRATLGRIHGVIGLARDPTEKTTSITGFSDESYRRQAALQEYASQMTEAEKASKISRSRFSLSRITNDRLEQAGEAYREAKAEGEETTIGKADPFANLSENRSFRAFRRAIEEVRLSSEESVSLGEQAALAEKMLGDMGYEKSKAHFVGRARRGEILNPHETLALHAVAEEAFRRAASTRGEAGILAFKEAAKLEWAYEDQRSAAGRTLGVIRDAVRNSNGSYMLREGIRMRSRYVRERLAEIDAKIASTPKSGRFSLLRERESLMEKDAEATAFAIQELRRAGLDPAADYSNDPATFARAAQIIAYAKAKKLHPKGKLVWDAVMEYRLSSMLSAVITHSRNIAGNTLHYAYEGPSKKFFEAILNTIVRNPDAASLPEFGVYLGSHLSGLTLFARTILRSYKADFPVFEYDMIRRGVNPDKLSTRLDADFSQRHNPALHAIPGKLGRVIRAPSLTSLMAWDQGFKAFASHTEMHAIAYRHSRGNRAEMRRLMSSPALWERAADHASKVTFQDRPNRATEPMFSAVMEGITRVRGAAKLGHVEIGEFLFPFLFTSARIFQRGGSIPLSPLLLAVELAKGSYNGKENKARLVRDAATAALSVGLTLLFREWALDEDEDGLPRITGTRSVTGRSGAVVDGMSFRIGDTWYSYSSLEPGATAIAIVIDALRATKSSSSTAENITSSLGQMIRTMYAHSKDATFLRTWGDIARAIEDPDGGSFHKLVRGTLITPLVPNLIRAPLRARNSFATVDSLRNNDERGLVASMWDSIPESWGGGNPILKRDWWGRPVKANGRSYWARVLSPTLATKDLSDILPIDKYFMRYNDAVDAGDLGNSANHWPAPPRPQYTMNGVKHWYTNEEYDQYAEESGRRALEIVSRMNIAEMPLEERVVKKVVQIHNKVRRMVREKILANKARNARDVAADSSGEDIGPEAVEDP